MHRCECADPLCPVCQGKHAGTHRAVGTPGHPDHTVTLQRIDWVGLPEITFCEACAADALDSGIFGCPDDEADE